MSETLTYADEWQPIETAPKGSGDILIFCPSSQEQFVACRNGSHWQFAYYDPNDSPIVCDKPSHWRPLPDPPALSRAQPAPDAEETGR